MNLKKYQTKRDFEKTPEPVTSDKNAKGPLNFCVQKHDARNLHYDFRLEFRGVLLSWAVPKGPSLDPKDKRLAIHVEDHPLDYQYFEGIIPKGNYGAGTVEIWDHGTYTTPKSQNKKEIEKEIALGLKIGHLAIILHGDKLNGEFVLQKLKKQEAKDTSWLLIKKNDAYILSEESQKKKPEKLLKKFKMPGFIPPMLATLIDKPFDDEDWLFEVKWDGFRSLAFVDKGEVQLKSRNNLSFNNKFLEIIKELKKAKGSIILDGEIVVIDEKGKSHFQLIQNYSSNEINVLCYYVFDILFKDGADLRELPLIERKEILKKYLSELNSPLIRFSDHVIKSGKNLFKAALKEHLEGIIGKKIASCYESRRSKAWVKIKSHMTQEIIICGFTEPKGSRKKFGALIAGIYDKNKILRFAGHVGGGFDEAVLVEIYNKLKPNIIKKCPFKNEPKVNTPVTWVKPKLIGEVVFSEWTKDNIMRHPIFKGLRIDKDDTKDVKKEILKKISKEKSKKTAESKIVKDITLTHLEKVYWPDEKITKGDLLTYYESISPYILPYLKERPIMLHRYPDGIAGKDFYQKDLNFTVPDGIETFSLTQEGKINHYLLINDLKSLLYAVNLGSIDLHPFLSHTETLANPDYCVIDLDPHDISFDKVIEAALVVHDILNTIKIKHYCKTSGGKGLHILIPLKAKYDYEQSRQFAEIVCHVVNKRLPKTTSMERSPQKRPNLIYLDCLQNRISQSIVAPYSVRPRQKALVSTPLSWDEVNKNLDVSTFTMKEVISRTKRQGDILKPLLGAGIDIKKALTGINKLI